MIIIVVMVLFNMLLIKRFIGSRLLSDGTHIKHRGMPGAELCRAWPYISTLNISWWPLDPVMPHHPQTAVTAVWN